MNFARSQYIKYQCLISAGYHFLDMFIYTDFTLNLIETFKFGRPLRLDVLEYPSVCSDDHIAICPYAHMVKTVRLYAHLPIWSGPYDYLRGPIQSTFQLKPQRDTYLLTIPYHTYHMGIAHMPKFVYTPP